MHRLISLLAPAYGHGGIKTLVWSQNLSIGNMIIDAEHRNLIRIVNEAIRAIDTRDCLVLLHELEHLGDWLHVHCTHEETIARSIDFPLVLLKPAQQYSQDTLRHLRDEMEMRYGLWSGDTAAYLSHLLRAWVIGHITAVDMPMRPLLRRRDYNFWPGYYATESAFPHKPVNPVADSPRCGYGCGYDNLSPAAK